MKRYVLVVLSVLSFSHPRNAEADVTLFWDSNFETDLAGYQILYGIAPRTYTAMVDVGNRTSHQFTNLEPGRTYFFAVRAYDTGGLASPLSAEVSTIAPNPAPLTVPTLLMSPVSPVKAGNRIVFGAAPSGGVTPYQYQWFITSGAYKALVKTWSTENIFIWTPPKSGRYTVAVWVRSATSTANAPDNAGSIGAIRLDVVP